MSSHNGHRVNHSVLQINLVVIGFSTLTVVKEGMVGKLIQAFLPPPLAPPVPYIQ